MVSKSIAVPVLAVLTLGGCGDSFGDDDSDSSCVAAGSLVDTPEGRRPIETLRPGDEIWSVDPHSGQRHRAQITVLRVAHRPCIRIGVPGETPLTLTHDHPVYSPDHDSYGDARHWVHGELTQLLQVGDEGVQVVSAIHLSRDAGTHEVFDITVDHDLHNFVANGVLVHNKSVTTTSEPPPTYETSTGEETESSTGPYLDLGGDGDGDGDTNAETGGDPMECEDWQTEHPEWIFCDDFEAVVPLVGVGRYFEVSDADGSLTHESGAGYLDSTAMRGQWMPGQVDAGSLKLAFGRNPNGYMDNGIRDDEDFREVYYRMMLKHEAGWTGSPAKLSRATVFTSADDWSQAMIAHLWSDDADHLLIDPARCVEGSTVQCVGYNDFNALTWLGAEAGPTTIFATDAADQWYCVEAHVRLNDPGMANGVQEFWIDGNLEVSRTDLDFVQNYEAYGINAVFLENYWNAGSPQQQARWFDNFVVSTEPIGCPGE